MIDFLTAWGGAIPAYMTPLLLASVGLILCERAGVLNLGPEGLMAAGAMMGAVLVLNGGSPWFGLVGGAMAGLLIGLPFAVAVIVLRADHILAGLATVAIGLGAAATVGRTYTHRPFASIGAWEIGPLADLPLIGPMLFRQDPMVYGAIAIALFAGWVLARTRLGLRLKAVGEDPSTADASGVDVQRYQFAAVLIGCALLGLAGAYLSVIASKVLVEGMIAGRGWVALALVVFAQWSPGRAIIGALIFASAEAIIPRLQTSGLDVPSYLLSMMPYILTIVILVIASQSKRRRSREPGHLGLPFIRQDR